MYGCVARVVVHLGVCVCECDVQCIILYLFLVVCAQHLVMGLYERVCVCLCMYVRASVWLSVCSGVYVRWCVCVPCAIGGVCVCVFCSYVFVYGRMCLAGCVRAWLMVRLCRIVCFYVFVGMGV